MAKKYFELYQEVKKLKPRTIGYYRAVSKMLKVEIDKEGLKRIREQRKNERYKKGKTFSQAVADFEAGIAYENKVVQRAYDIFTGAYLDKITTTYADNYIKALERNNIDADIIEFLRNNTEIIKMGGLPPITDYYIPSKGSSKTYSLNIDNSEELNKVLRDDLERIFGMPKLEKVAK